MSEIEDTFTETPFESSSNSIPFTEREITIIAKTRKAFGRTMLRSLSDEQCVKFYRTMRQLYAQRAIAPYETLTKLIFAWNVFCEEPRPTHNSLMQVVRKAGIRLFGRLEKFPVQPQGSLIPVEKLDKASTPSASQTPQTLLTPQLPQTPQKQFPQIESNVAPFDIETALKSKFDPLKETIDLVFRLKDELVHWSKISREQERPDQHVAKIAGVLRETLKDVRAFFNELGLLDEETVADMSSRLNIGTLNIAIQNNVQNPQNLSNFMNKFASAIVAQTAIETDLIEANTPNETESCTANSEPRTSSSDNASTGERKRPSTIGD